jgi:hypothetical protein
MPKEEERIRFVGLEVTRTALAMLQAANWPKTKEVWDTPLKQRKNVSCELRQGKEFVVDSPVTRVK